MSRQARAALTLLVAGLTACNVCLATPQGWGRVTMQGAILETACAIDTSSRDQTITMATMPVSQISRDGVGSMRLFVVKLVNCTLVRLDPKQPNWQNFQITFDGVADTGGFNLEGEAKGVALQIADERGHIAIPGVPMPAIGITPGDRYLNYTLRLISNKKILKPGDYFSTVRFKMDYY